MYNEGVKKTTFNKGKTMFSIFSGNNIVTFKVDGDKVAISRAGSFTCFNIEMPVEAARAAYSELLRQGFVPLD